MNTNKSKIAQLLPLLFLVAGCKGFQSSEIGAGAQSGECPKWENLDGYSESGVQSPLAGHFLIDSLGNYFYGAYMMPDLNTWIVRTSSDKGKTWTTSDQFQGPTHLYLNTYSMGVTEDSMGKLYVSGTANFSGSETCLVKMSSDHGQSWSIVDQYIYPGTINCKTYNVQAIGSSVFSLGRSGDGNLNHWLIRRSQDGGASWSIVDYPHASSPYTSKPLRMVTTANGNLLLFGAHWNATGAHFIFRKSYDGGSTWGSETSYQETNAELAVGGLIKASDGTLFATGWAIESSATIFRGLILRSVDDGDTWTVVDNYKVNNGRTLNLGVAQDSWGRLFSLYTAVDGTPTVASLRVSLDNGLSWQDFPQIPLDNTDTALYSNIYIDSSNQMIITSSQGARAVVQRLQLVEPSRTCN
jgi:hypothetical protein